jgi:hypothetical protein
MNGEVRGTDMNVIRVGRSGLICFFVVDSHPDLAVGLFHLGPSGLINPSAQADDTDVVAAHFTTKL